jgi:hypothetical protein
MEMLMVGPPFLRSPYEAVGFSRQEKSSKMVRQRFPLRSGPYQQDGQEMGNYASATTMIPVL